MTFRERVRKRPISGAPFQEGLGGKVKGEEAGGLEDQKIFRFESLADMLGASPPNGARAKN